MSVRETNIEFVTRIMESGSPLRQAFIIEAISRYAAQCATLPAETFDTPYLSGAAWLDVAKAINFEVVKRFNADATLSKDFNS